MISDFTVDSVDVFHKVDFVFNWRRLGESKSFIDYSTKTKLLEQIEGYLKYLEEISEEEFDEYCYRIDIGLRHFSSIDCLEWLKKELKQNNVTVKELKQVSNTLPYLVKGRYIVSDRTPMC